ncbi:MAG TPA: alpha/beta hydrolase fold domain-containing protein [Pirellulales bacterium]|jgi:acetyl esterase/lipase|nr:alpha/beta hydrolase fold domain-containing protein [Pirellulales bacterium]
MLVSLLFGADEPPKKTYPNVAGRAVCDRVRFVPARGYERDMVGGKIAGSNVSATAGYEVLATITDLPKSGEWNELEFDGRRPYRWLRYEAPPGSWGHLSKFEFYAGKRRINGQNFGSIDPKTVSSAWPRVFDGKDKKFNQFMDCEHPDGQYVGTDTLDFSTAVRPIMEPPPGTFAGPIKLTLRSPTPGTVIRYTLDGTLPDPQTGTIYTQPIAVDDVTTLVAVSCKEGFASSSATTGTYLLGPHAKPGLKTFHIGNSLTQSTARFGDYARTFGYNHDYRKFLRPGIWTWDLWENHVVAGDEEWKTTFAGLEAVDHFTVQPRDPDIEHEAKYDLLFFDLMRQRFPDVQPWLYAEWTSRARERDWDRGLVRSAQMKQVFPALTWEESASAMLVYMEDLRDKVLETYQGKKRPRVLPSVLAAGWIKPWLERGMVPGMTGKDFDRVMFSDCVHPGFEGQYLIDLTWFGAFYGISPECRVLPVNTTLSTAGAEAMQRLAWDVVKNYPDCGVYEEGSAPVYAPKFSVPPTKLHAITRVTLSSVTPGAWFRYTLDGTTPSRTRGYVYCGVISVRPGMTVKAVAYKSGMADSTVVEATYPAVQPTVPPPEIPPSVVLQQDVQFGQAGRDPLLLDIVRPSAPSEQPRPAILYIHGGGWNAGDKAQHLSLLLPYAATGQYVCASANYRLASQAPWPAQLHDCKAALRWLRAHARDLNIDPQRIGAIGGSAGGHLVSMLALTGDDPALEGFSGWQGRSTQVACAVDLCGPTNLVTFAQGKRRNGVPIEPMISLLLGGPVAEREDVGRQASPINHVASGAPPILIAHGTNDGVVPLAQSLDFYTALKKAGDDVTLIKIVGADHRADSAEALERVHQFFDKHLRGEKIDIHDGEVSAAPAK